MIFLGFEKIGVWICVLGNLDDEGEINKRTTVILSVWQPRN